MSAAHIRTAHACDMEAVAQVQHEAFGRVAATLGIDAAQLPPLGEGPEDLRRLHADGTLFLVAESNGQIVGGVRATTCEDGVEIGRLVVASGRTREGIGTALMDAIEAAFPRGSRFVLFTGAEARGPLELYAKRGYRLLRLDHSGPVELAWLEKHA